MASRIGVVRVHVDDGRGAVGLRGEQLGDRVAGGRVREAVGAHPLVVEDLAEVAAAAVGQQHHDHVVGAGGCRGLERRDHGHAARPADEDALLAREPARHLERLGVGHRDDLVRHGGVVGRRPEVLADALDEVRAPGAARVDRALGVGADDAHGVARHLAQVPPGSRDRAARADAGHEVRDRAVGVAPDLGAGGLVVRARTVGVRVLVGLERAGDLACEAVGDAVVRLGAVGRDGRGRHHDLGAVRGEHVALVLADLVGAHEDAPVAALLGDEREAHAGVAGGRLHDGAAGLQLALGLRGVDDPPRDAVLRRAARVEVLELHQHRGIRHPLGDPVELDERGVADEIDDGLCVLHAVFIPRVSASWAPDAVRDAEKGSPLSATTTQHGRAHALRLAGLRRRTLGRSPRREHGSAGSPGVLPAACVRMEPTSR